MATKKEIGEKATAVKKTTVKKTSTTRNACAKKASARAGQPRGHRVAITYMSEPGRQVFIAGSFNNWDATAKQLVDAKGNGEYFVRFLLKAGVYQYKLVVDGQWILDPANSSTEPNEFGTQNNILIVSDEN